jgi:hypothetical protein
MRDEDAQKDAFENGIKLEVVNRPEGQKDLSFFPADGSSSAASVGWQNSAASPEISKGCPRRLQDSTLLPLLY